LDLATSEQAPFALPNKWMDSKGEPLAGVEGAEPLAFFPLTRLPFTRCPPDDGT